MSPELDLSSDTDEVTTTTGTSILSGILTYISNGGSIVSVLQASIVGLVLSPFLALANIITAVGTFFTTPFRQGGLALGDLIIAFFRAPAQLLQTAAQINEDALRIFLSDSLAGLFAFPLTMAVVLAGLFLMMVYLQEEETGDTLPGLPFDVPDFGPFQFGVEEEDDADD